jgi:hypothetical protein
LRSLWSLMALAFRSKRMRKGPAGGATVQVLTLLRKGALMLAPESEVCWPVACSARQEARERAMAHHNNGNLIAAQECYQRAVDVTPSMAKQLIEVQRAAAARYLVNPLHVCALTCWQRPWSELDCLTAGTSRSCRRSKPKARSLWWHPMRLMHSWHSWRSVALYGLSSRRTLTSWHMAALGCVACL